MKRNSSHGSRGDNNYSSLHPEPIISLQKQSLCFHGLCESHSAFRYDSSAFLLSQPKWQSPLRDRRSPPPTSLILDRRARSGRRSVAGGREGRGGQLRGPRFIVCWCGRLMTAPLNLISPTCQLSSPTICQRAASRVGRAVGRASKRRGNGAWSLRAPRAPGSDCKGASQLGEY